MYVIEQIIAAVNSNMAKYQLKPGDSMVQATAIGDLEGFGMQHITHKPSEEKTKKKRDFPKLNKLVNLLA
jgi:hypothetical protein